MQMTCYPSWHHVEGRSRQEGRKAIPRKNAAVRIASGPGLASGYSGTGIGRRMPSSEPCGEGGSE